MKILTLSMPLTALGRFSHEDLNPGEIIIYRARLNFIAFMLSSKTWIVIFGVGVLVLLGAFIYGDIIGFLQDDTITLGVSLFAAVFLLWGGYGFSVRLIDWLYDEDIITSQRVVDYNQKFLFSKDLSTANLKEIQNIILNQEGIFPTIFNYGTLDIQTSSSATAAHRGQVDQYLILDDISRPKNVQRLIDEVAFRVKKDVVIDRDELLIMCGLKKGDLNEYFVVKKARGWKSRVRKLLKWEDS